MSFVSYYRHHAHQLLNGARWWRYWLHRRPLLVGSISVIVLSWLLMLAVTAPAYAADAAAAANDLTDTNGIPISAYHELPVGDGGLLNPGGQANHWFLTALWSAVHKNAVGLLGAFAFVFSFDWVLWLAGPFQGLSFVIGQMFGGGAAVPALLTITALVGGIVVLSGRTAAGFTEIFLAAVASALLAGALQNPTQWLTGDHGALTTVAGWARELATVTATGQSGSDVALDTAVTMPLVDIAVRMPFHHAAFGQELTGECARVLERALLAGDDGQAIRDQIRGCNPEAAEHADTATMDTIMGLWLSSLGRLGAMLPLGLGVLTATVTVVLVLFDSVKMLLGLYIALLPFNKQMAWRAGLGMVMGLLSLLLQVVLIVGWGKAVVELVRAGTEALSYDVMQYTLTTVFLALAAVLIIVAWQMRQRAKTLADKASRLGASMQPVKPLPVAAAASRAWRAADAGFRLATNQRLSQLGAARTAPAAVPPVTAPGQQLPESRRRMHIAARQALPGPLPPAAGQASSPKPGPAPSAPPPTQEGTFHRLDRPAKRSSSAGRVAAGVAKVAIAGIVSGGPGALTQGAVELGGAAVGAVAQRVRRVVPDPKTGVATITSLRPAPIALPPAQHQPRAIAPTPAQRALQRRLQEARS